MADADVFAMLPLSAVLSRQVAAVCRRRLPRSFTDASRQPALPPRPRRAAAGSLPPVTEERQRRVPWVGATDARGRRRQQQQDHADDEGQHLSASAAVQRRRQFPCKRALRRGIIDQPTYAPTINHGIFHVRFSKNND